jgi:hypothetical protein
MKIRSAINFATRFAVFRIWFGAALRFYHTCQHLRLENFALHQQLLVLKRRHPKTRLGLFDKLFVLPFADSGTTGKSASIWSLLTLCLWLAKLGTGTRYIEPGSPWENGYCESFNLLAARRDASWRGRGEG